MNQLLFSRTDDEFLGDEFEEDPFFTPTNEEKDFVVPRSVRADVIPQVNCLVLFTKKFWSSNFFSWWNSIFISFVETSRWECHVFETSFKISIHAVEISQSKYHDLKSFSNNRKKRTLTFCRDVASKMSLNCQTEPGSLDDRSFNSNKKWFTETAEIILVIWTLKYLSTKQKIMDRKFLKLFKQLSKIQLID